LLILCALVLGQLPLAGCGSPGPSDAPALVISREQEDAWVRDFNPLRQSSRWPSGCGIYETLMIYNIMKSDYEPWLATGYAWDETDHAVSFTLRPGVRWSDGTSFTADDVVFTFELIKKYPDLDTKGVWGYLSAVRAEDDEHVLFVFKYTFVPGLVNLAHLPIVPRHVWQEVADPVAFTNDNPVATGPFTEVLRFEDEVWELGRNPYYWQSGKPVVERLRFPLYKNNEEAIAALLRGEVDWSGNFVPDAEQTYVADDPEHRVFWSPMGIGNVFLYFNTTLAPFDDAGVRKALSMAINRDRIVREAMSGYTQPADATGLSYTKKDIKSPKALELGTWMTYDPEAAAKQLDDLGFPKGADGWRGPAGGEPWSFEILVVKGWTDWIDTARLIAEGFADIGVNARVKTIPFLEWQDRISHGRFEASIGHIEMGPDPYNEYRWLMSSESVVPVGDLAGSNWHRFGDTGADALLEAIEMTSEEDVQQILYEQLQVKFAELAPALPLFYGNFWGTANTTRFVGFPSAENPYAVLSPNSQPGCTIVLANLRPRED